ncbi:V-type ATP synthase subunit I [Anaerorhabdus furcosa]|uniref:V/A-type H+-transporting ATPase subunit I n=1 Tax=Anaerorhabdus furcosa TaxID=118967 RepID=A0A1T4PSN0_9FIRM|nr:V-type ATPase 116kDa subunit family protein [Anaerorhabdus furcosa]SJZ94237.1 V/A-type H+-transporting ATPase subunit I [Anaerorhabdus furcosa]
MSITKMKLVSISASEGNYEEMLKRCETSKYLHAENATSIVNEENGGRLLSIENIYSDYVNTLKNIGHSIGFEMKAKPTLEKTYTNEEIETFLKNVEEQFKVVSDSVESNSLTGDDEIALETLRLLDFTAMHDCHYISFGMGRLPIESVKKLNLIQDAKFITAKLHQTSQYQWIVYATSNTYARETKKMFDGLYLEEIKIPTIDSKKIIAQYEEELTNVYTYCEERNRLYSLHQYVSIFEDHYVVVGFVPEKDLDKFKTEFNGVDVSVDAHNTSDAPNLTPPTLLKNNWFFRPFEMFVTMYSLPAYRDMDPTVFVGITYCFLFGIMFGDLGQGFLLLLGGLFLEWKSKNKLAGIVGRVGITSMIFGFLFGSVFGNEEILIPVHRGLFNVHEKLINVMDGNFTMTLLISAVVIGAVLILITMVMNMAMHLKHKDWGELFFSQNGLAGFAFYGYLFVAIAGQFVFGFNILTPMWMIPFIGLPIVLFFFKEPLSHLIQGKSIKPHGGWGNFVLETFFEVFEILLSFVTNSMSYLRVGGFVLSHAGMMLVVMTLVEMTGNAGPVVFVIGNLFVMALEGLIVGIQTLRLEYYEMFSRYFEGGGKKFNLISSDN